MEGKERWMEGFRFLSGVNTKILLKFCDSWNSHSCSTAHSIIFVLSSKKWEYGQLFYS